MIENRGQGILNSKSEFKKQTGEKEMDQRDRKLMTRSQKREEEEEQARKIEQELRSPL